MKNYSVKLQAVLNFVLTNERDKTLHDDKYLFYLFFCFICENKMFAKTIE